MERKYQIWIEKNVPNFKAAYGTCREVTVRMQEEFPELERVRGYFQCAIWGRRPHWWLRTPEGEIVDPTGHQHPSFSMASPEWYQELKDTDPIPTGRCMECGADCFDGESFCTKTCDDSFSAAMGWVK